ncbi:MAG: hypothetical protein Q9213_005822 [Squamulea squamosa]
MEVGRLLREGVDPNEVDDEGETALHQAAWRGHAHVTKVLLDRDNPLGTLLNTKDRLGQTPLHHAASTGSKAVVQQLLYKGALPNEEDLDGSKPRSLAKENFHPSTVKLLGDWESRLADNDVLPDIGNILSISPNPKRLDPALLAALSIESDTATMEAYGQASSTTPSKVTVARHGYINTYFMKTGPNIAMFRGEYESLNAIHAAVPSLCPLPIGHGRLSDSPDSLLLTEFIDIETTSNAQTGLSLAQKLAQLHTAPSPIPHGSPQPAFGFHIPTSVGRTLQDNTWSTSWADFFANNRLRLVGRIIQSTYGDTDTGLQKLLARVIDEVVPHLLRDGHLGGERGITPSLVHGDLWPGNYTRGIVGGKGGVEEVIFDPGSCCAHSEYELGIMRMFGGFSSGFFKEYHRLVPKTEPVEEYQGRLELYQL